MGDIRKWKKETIKKNIMLNFMQNIANEHYRRAGELNSIICINKLYYGSVYEQTLEYKLYKYDINVHILIGSIIDKLIKLFK